MRIGKKQESRNIFVADFETTSVAQYEIEKETRVYLWRYVDINNDNVNMGVNIETFFKSLLELNDNVIMYFHNLSFDGEFILWYLMRNGYKDVGEEFNTKKESYTFTSIITDLNAIFQIYVGLPNGHTVEFRCSYKVFPNSIEKIGEMVGVEKLKESHNYDEIKNYKTLDEVTEEEIMYITNDVEILRRIICYLKSLNMLSISMSTNSYKFWRKKNYLFTKYELIKSNDERINKAIDDSYRGGITQVNKKYQGVLVDKCISYDVNSLYPWAMYSHSMPFGEGVYFDKIEQCNYAKRLIGVYIVSATILDGLIPFIGTTKGFSFNKVYEYSETIKDTYLYLWEEEWDLFQQCYHGDYNVVCCIGFKEKKMLFNEYIDYWMSIKEKAKSDSAERQFSKLCLNSLYGKFGMNSIRYSKKARKIEQDKIIYDLDLSETFYYYRPIASYICAMARCKLIRAIILNASRFLYCDTDSIYLVGWEEPKGLEIHNTKLGAWKFEHYYNHFKGLKAKCYIKDYTDNKGNIKVESGIAGLPKDARKDITYDNFKDGLEIKNCKKVKMKVKGGIIIGKTSFKIKV